MTPLIIAALIAIAFACVRGIAALDRRERARRRRRIVAELARHPVSGGES